MLDQSTNSIKADSAVKRSTRRKNSKAVITDAAVSPSLDEGSVSELSKRSRGRPRGKQANTPYERLLVSQNVRDSILRLGQKSTLTRPTIAARVEEIMANSEANTYYFRCVYSLAFSQYSTQITMIESRNAIVQNAGGETPLISEAEDTRPKGRGRPKSSQLTIKTFSESANLEYFNFLRLFKGGGNSQTVMKFLLFMYRNELDFAACMFDAGVVEKAYLYLTLLKEGQMDDLIRNRLFE